MRLKTVLFDVVKPQNTLVLLLILSFLLPSFLYSPQIVSAAFNQEINYQGKLLDSGGSPVSDGNYSMVFSLYTVASGGSNIWTETQSVPVTSGLFSTMLGTTTSLASVDFDQTLYLGVNIAGDGEMLPRKVLGAVPAAFALGRVTVGSSLMGAGSNITMTAFIDHDRTGDSYQRIFEKADGTTGTNGYGFVANTATTNGTLYTVIDASSYNPGVGNTIPQDTWVHVASVIDDGADTVTEYIAASSSVYSGALSIPLAGTDARIGVRVDTGSRPFNGVIDELRLASTTRSDAWIAAESLNHSTTTDFYNTTTGIPDYLHLTDNDGGQVSNTFTMRSDTDTELFAFKLGTSTNNSHTVTDLSVQLSGAHDITASNFSNVELYKDNDGDAQYDSGGDTLIGSGSVILSGQIGSIDFTTDFTVTGQTNYLVVGDYTGVGTGESVVLSLLPRDIVTSTVVASGTIPTVQHVRNSVGGTSYFGAGSGEIGDPIGENDGEVTGGTNDGGETIGDEPNFEWPTGGAGSWTGLANAYDQIDGTYASANTSVVSQFQNFGFSIPGTDDIDGIEVKLEVSGTTPAGDIDVQLTWNGGTGLTTAKNTGTLTGTDAVVSVGSPTDTWGRGWSAAEFGNGSFEVHVTSNPSSNTVQIDAIQVKIHHSTSGGGGGGGGAI